MAQAGLLLDKDQFNCSICLDVLREPVTIPCGHSYCLRCIRGYWDQDDFPGVFVCPQCRHNFSQRPNLALNTMLADVVDRFKKTGLHEAAPSFAEANDVECDVCTGRKNRAVHSCLVCLASYCDVHVQPHYESAAFKKHRLVSASNKLQETLCPRHDKLLEVFCRTDKQCCCYLCLTDEHKGHDTVLVEVEVHDRQRQLGDMKLSSQLRIEFREKEAQQLRQAMASLTHSARSSIEDSDAVLTELIRSFELKRFEVRELIKAQEKTSLAQAERLLDKIQKEIGELKKSEAELDKLSHTEDHIHFLQSCQTFHAPPALSARPPVSVDPNMTFGPVMTAVTDFKGLLQEVCQGGFVSIYERVREVRIVGSPDPADPESADTASNTLMEATGATPPPGLDQAPVTPLNPFLSQGASVPTFAGFSPLGPKFSSANRHRHPQRRSHLRRK